MRRATEGDVDPVAADSDIDGAILGHQPVNLPPDGLGDGRAGRFIGGGDMFQRQVQGCVVELVALRGMTIRVCVVARAEIRRAQELGELLRADVAVGGDDRTGVTEPNVGCCGTGGKRSGAMRGAVSASIETARKPAGSGQVMGPVTGFLFRDTCAQ